MKTRFHAPAFKCNLYRYIMALAFRTEIWFVAWGAAAVSRTGKGKGGGLAWGEPKLLRRVLPGAEGALRSLAAAGRWLGRTHSRVSDFLHGPHWLSSIEPCFDCRVVTLGCQICHMDYYTG